MRIAIIYPSLEVPRGGEVHISQLAKYLLGRGHEIGIFTFAFDQDTFQYSHLLDGARVVERRRILQPLPVVRSMETVLLLRAFGRALEREGYDLVYACNEEAPWIARFTNLPTIWQCNNIPIPIHRTVLLRQLHTLLTAPLARIFVINQADADWLRRAGYRQPIEVVGFGAELQRPVAHVDDGTIDVLYVGPLISERGVLEILETFRRASERVGEPMALHLVGAGELEGEVRGRAEKHGIPVRFHGRVTTEELHGLYDLADVAIFLQKKHWSVAPLQPIVAGIPTIVSDSFGLLDVIPDYPLVADTGDLESSTKLMVDVVLNGDEWRDRMSGIASELRPALSWESYGKGVEGLFFETIEGEHGA